MPAVKDGMRGLAIFISDIRNCKSKEAELKRINKELANIRSKFKGDKVLDGYQKKKYVSKLLFIFLLGHDINFGHLEAISLLSSSKYTEKQIGYLFISVIVSPSSESFNLLINCLLQDLRSRSPVFVSLALQCLANIGTVDMVDAVGNDVCRLLTSMETSEFVKQTAALCLLKLIRINKAVIPRESTWASQICQLLNDPHLGVVTSACSLIEKLVQLNPADYKSCQAIAVLRLSKIVSSVGTELMDYTYYFVPAPWITVKLLRLLQSFTPPEDPATRDKLNDCIENILARSQEPLKSKKIQHSNSKNAVLFEAINLIVNFDSNASLMTRANSQLGLLLNHRDTNLRYLAMDSLCKMAGSEFSQPNEKSHLDAVVGVLRSEKDVSVCQKAVDLLYVMCDSKNAIDVVAEMLDFLKSADYSIREELVLKVAILAEKFATDLRWYVDTMLELIRIGGDFVGEEVWYRVVQVVISQEDVQAYAAKVAFTSLQSADCQEVMVKVGCYILGEFGNLIAGDPSSSPLAQFQLLQSLYPLMTNPSKCILLTSFIKLVNLFPEIKQAVQEAFRYDMNIRNSDAELQQRTVEYLQLSSIASQDLLATILEEMPPFPERESSLLAKLKKKSSSTMDGGDTATAANPQVSSTTAVLTAPTLTSNAVPRSLPSQTAASGLLFDLSEPSSPQSNHTEVASSIDEALPRFLAKSTGVLFENDFVQVGLRSDFKERTGVLVLYFGNKTSYSFLNVTTKMITKEQAGKGLVARAGPCPTSIEAGAQAQQQVEVECLSDFTESPILEVRFCVGSTMQVLNLKLPVFMSKFFSPVTMTATDFFARWKLLSSPGQECQKIFRANASMVRTDVIAMLNGYRMGNHDGVDPNPQNYVAAGIIHTASGQIGVLLRLEPNQETQMYRLTVRSAKDGIASILCEHLQRLF